MNENVFTSEVAKGSFHMNKVQSSPDRDVYADLTWPIWRNEVSHDSRCANVVPPRQGKVSIPHEPHF